MTSSAHSPNSVIEKYVISRENSSITFEIGSNVFLHLGSQDENGRDRDSSNVFSKTIMDHRGDVRSLLGQILSTNEGLVGFRSVYDTVGESVNVINLLTKQRYRLKEFSGHNVLDIAFAHHNNLFAILDSDSSIHIYKVSNDCQLSKFLSISNWPSKSSRDVSEHPRLSWCPYMPREDEDEDDVIHMIAIYTGRHMHILNISNLKEQGDEFDFEQAKKVEGGVYSLTLEDESENKDSRIVSVCISPDSTALAVAKSDGLILFYVINFEDGTLKNAHNFDPRCFERNEPITGLFFLDDLTPERKDVPFWRTCVVISNGGKRFALFECQTWKCLGKVRFESALAVNDFIPIIDPAANFIHLLDVDGMNVYSVEVVNPVCADEFPRFVGVTQTSFSAPIYTIASITKNSFENDSSEMFYDEDEYDYEEDVIEGDIVKGKRKRIRAKRHFVAIGKRNIVELQLTLKQHLNSRVETYRSDPSVDEDDVSPAKKETTSCPGLMMTVPPEVHLDTVSSPTIEQILSKIEKLEESQKESTIRLCDSISTLDLRMRERESYMLNRIEQMVETARLDTLSAIRNGMGSIIAQTEAGIRNGNVETSEYISQRVGSSVRSGLQECVIPSFERTCDLLFERINEQFRVGINEYLSNTNHAIQNAAMATVQLAMQKPREPSGSAQADLDRITICNLITQKPEMALENALNKGDPSLLEYVCSNVNPDILFSPRLILTQPVLISLLHQLTLTLHHERDMKYRYIEQILPAVDLNDPDVAQVAPNVGSQLLTALQDILAKTTDSNVRRLTRLLFQLARSTFYQSPHPQRSLLTSSQQSPM